MKASVGPIIDQGSTSGLNYYHGHFWHDKKHCGKLMMAFLRRLSGFSQPQFWESLGDQGVSVCFSCVSADPEEEAFDVLIPGPVGGDNV